MSKIVLEVGGEKKQPRRGYVLAKVEFDLYYGPGRVCLQEIDYYGVRELEAAKSRARGVTEATGGPGPGYSYVVLRADEYDKHAK